MKRRERPYIHLRTATYGCLLGCIALTTGCGTLPRNPPRPYMESLSTATDGLLTDTRTDVTKKLKEGESAFLLVDSNRDALQWRLALVDHATTSVDVKVFIWQDDETGRLLLSRVLAAADRGVRVRMLVDDMPVTSSDSSLATLAIHPNVNLRVFNPGLVRRGIIGPMMQMVIYFKELNVRMHNKLMVVDGHWAIAGGRNIGNAYFGTSKKYNFRDLDVLTTGPIVEQLADAFDDYWNSDPAYPAEAMAKLKPKKVEKNQRDFEKTLLRDRNFLEQTSYTIDTKDWSKEFVALPYLMIGGTATYAHDTPVVKSDKGERLLDSLRQTIEGAEESLTIVTPYMIPPRTLMRALRATEDTGVDVLIVTASMAANNHTVAHSHYKKYRKRLLETGAELFEYKHQPTPTERSLCDESSVTSKFIALHIKATCIDNRRLYIGSLNMDPRALKINTENVMVIDSPELARAFNERVTRMIHRKNAWEVYRQENGKLRWRSSEGERRCQPARGFRQRVADFFFRWLPIERQL
jgi:putative cardiolipin synthase